MICVAMGGTQSVAIPGGGTEGYHVLRVSRVYRCLVQAPSLQNGGASLDAHVEAAIWGPNVSVWVSKMSSNYSSKC